LIPFFSSQAKDDAHWEGELSFPFSVPFFFPLFSLPLILLVKKKFLGALAFLSQVLTLFSFSLHSLLQ